MVCIIISSGEMRVHGWGNSKYTKVSGNISEKIIFEPGLEILGEGKWKGSVILDASKGTDS